MSDEGKEEVAIESTAENTEPETKPDEAVEDQEASVEATSSEAEAPQAEAKADDEEPKEKDVAEPEPEPSASTEEKPEETKEEEEPVPEPESSAKEETAAEDDDESELILNDDDEDEGEAAPKKRLRLRSRADKSEDDDVVLGDEESEEDSGKSSRKEKLKRKKRATRSQEDEESKEETNGKEAAEEDSLADERRQAMKDIFGEGSDSDEDQPEIHIESDQEEDMDFESSKTALERLKKKSRAKKGKMTDNDDEDEGKKRKRQSRKKKGDGEEKKRRRSRQEDEEGENPEEDDGGDRVTEGGSSKKPRKEADEFDKIISTIRGGYRRRRPNLGGDEGKAKISELVNQMFLAHESDLAAYEAKKPATQKLKLLQEVVENFSRKVFTHTVVECDGLRAIRLWLEPLPGGTLPNINIRKSLLDVLGRLPVDQESLKSSRIAGVVLFLARNPSETPENKALARQLIDSWSRPIFGISSSYESHHDDEEVEPSAPREVPRNKVVVATASTDTGLEDPVKKSSTASSSSSSTTNLLEYPTQGIHARIPRPVAFDFTKRPVSRLEVTEKSKPDPKRLNLERSMQNLKKKKVKNARAVSLSIEGRRIML